jgi:penicillin amidase
LRKQVSEWNPRAAADASGYLQVREFHETLARRVFDALTLPARAANPGLKLKVPRQFEEAAWELVAARPVHLLDPRFKDWRAFMLDVVDESIEATTKLCPGTPGATCRWGDANATVIQHPLSRAVPLLSRWLDMPREPMGGDHDMPHVHTSGFGASERFAVSPGHEAQAYFHMPGRPERSSAIALLPCRTRGLGPWQAVALSAGQGHAYTHPEPRFEPLSLLALASPIGMSCKLSANEPPRLLL